MINTRDEPHADADKYRRLHVIIGDANLAETPPTSSSAPPRWCWRMIEAGWALPSVELAHPVAAVHQISHDPTLKVTVPLTDGRELTGVDIQRAYAEAAAKFVEAEYGSDVDEQTADVLARWIRRAGPAGPRPDGPGRRAGLAGQAAAAGGVPQPGRARAGAPRLALVDLQYSDVRMDKGLYNRLVSRGSMQRLVTEDAGAGGDDRTARGHPGLLPRPVRVQVRRPAGGGVLGLGDLRRRPGVAGPDPDHGADPRHQGARRARCWTPPPTPPNWSTR